MKKPFIDVEFQEELPHELVLQISHSISEVVEQYRWGRGGLKDDGVTPIFDVFISGNVRESDD